MQIRMLKVSASAALCADAGEVVTVADDLGLQLIAAGAALRTATPQRETAMIDPAQIERDERERARQIAEEEARRKSPENVKAALDLLDAAADDDWTAGGKPAMDRLKALTGSVSLSRADVDAAFPNYKRPAEPSSTATVPKVPSTAAKSGPRSSAP